MTTLAKDRRLDPRRKFLVDLVQSNFEHLANRGAPLCSCRDFSFQRGASPDYGDSDVQSLYLSRFAAAYYGEYHWVFENEILPKLKTSSPTILSIGTGSGLDLAAMAHCLQSQQKKFTPTLIGVDRTRWDAVQTVFPDLEARFVEADLGDAESLAILADTEFDVISFPRSLGEIYGVVRERLLGALDRVRCKRRHVIVSFARKEPVYLKQDVAAFKAIALRWEARGFRSDSELGEYSKFEPEDSWRVRCAPWWHFPSGVYDGLEHFQELCSQHQVCNESVICKSDFSRMRPMMKSGYARWQLAEFRRRP